MAATTATTALIYGLIFGAQIFSFVVGVSRLTETATEFMAQLDWTPTEIMAADPRDISAAGRGDGIVRRDGHHRADRDAARAAVSATTSCGGASSTSASSRPASSIRRLGLNVFVLKSIQPDVSIWTVYKGVAPFVVADLVKLALLVAFPGIALWLVSTMAQ